MIITTELFLNFKPSFPKIYQQTLNLFRGVNLRNVSFKRLLHRILRQIYLYSDKCQQIEQVYTRKLNSLNPEPIYSPLIEYLSMRIMFLDDRQLEAIAKRMDDVFKKLLAEVDNLYNCDDVFEKIINPLDGDVEMINSEMISLSTLINEDLQKNVDALQKALDSLDQKTSKIHTIIIGKDVQNNIHQASADCLDEAVKMIDEFIKDLYTVRSINSSL